jgi:putative flavoprotein involved in K+ transport
MTILDTVIIGAGQAGLGVSYYLQQNGRKHTVFEQGRIGESWLSQRWDSFTLNTPNIMNVLPGFQYNGLEPDGFGRADELVHYFQRYIEHFQLPVRTGVAVVSVEQSEDQEHFIVKIKTNGQRVEVITCRSVVIASGSQQTPKFPAIRSRLPDDIVQLHTTDYHSAALLPPGAIVRVGRGH